MNTTFIRNVCALALVSAINLTCTANAETSNVTPIATKDATNNSFSLSGKWHGPKGSALVVQTGDLVVLDTGANVFSGTARGNVIRGNWKSRQFVTGGKFRVVLNSEQDKFTGWYSVDYVNDSTFEGPEHRPFYADRMPKAGHSAATETVTEGCV